MEMTEREAQFWDREAEYEREAQEELFYNKDEFGWEEDETVANIINNIDRLLYNVGLETKDFTIGFGVIDTEEGNDYEIDDIRKIRDYRKFVLEEVQADLDDKVIFFWVYEI